MRCLIVVRNRAELGIHENSLKNKIGRICPVDVVDIEYLYETQEKWDLFRYTVVLTFLGDGTVLKTLSVCTGKNNGFEKAEYMDFDISWPMHSSGSTPNNSDLLLEKGRNTPIIFSFDYGAKGRLCNIKKHIQEEGDALLDELLNAISQNNQEKVLELYINRTIKRNRLFINQSVYFLNDIYVYTKAKGLLGSISISINEKPVYRCIRCDGVVISTPTGSSGYNSSAGGPVIHGSIDDAIIITFVCPADKKVSPIVVSASCKIRVKNGIENDLVFGVVDGCLSISDYELRIEGRKEGAVYFADVTTDRIHSDFMEAIQE
ncbi:NAD+ kinase [Nematocida sp. AWRm78]|nr:NAD+ kinase [Nematocida sp. AWRm78]